MFRQLAVLFVGFLSLAVAVVYMIGFDVAAPFVLEALRNL